jgi:hypothetical protein
MSHGNERARAISLTKRVACAATLTLITLWAVLPRSANATRNGPRTVAESNEPNLLREQQPDPFPQTVLVTGRVLDPHGRPVAGATLHLQPDSGEPAWREPAGPPPAQASTDADGRFEFTVERSLLAAARSRRARFSGPFLAAFAPGYGPAWTDDLMIGEPGGVVLKLVEDLPITGRLIDLEGRPAPGITVRVIQVDATPGGDLSRWLEYTHKESNGFLTFNHFTTSLPLRLSTLFRTATTAEDGSFRLPGSGRERLVSLLIEGPRFETRVVKVMTRRGPSASIRFQRPDGNRQITIHPADFSAVAAPTRAVEGIVTDASNGSPLEGVAIRADLNSRTGAIAPYPLFDWPGMFIRAKTDSRGHYRLTGLPMRDAVGLQANPAESQPYLPASRDFANPPGVNPTACDFALKQGNLVRGRLTERSTGKPASGLVQYRPTVDNANISSRRELDALEPNPVHEDGQCTVVAMSGPGVVVATAEGDRFLTADVSEFSTNRPFPNVGGSLTSRQCHAFEAISPVKPSEVYQCDLALTPAPEPTVTILDSDGRPLAGTKVTGIPPADVAREGWWQTREKSVFHVAGLADHRIRRISIHHVERRLAGTLAVRDADPTPLVARLRPWGVVAGRLVDRAGQPRPGVELSYHQTISGKTPLPRHIPRDVTTDSDGRFTFEGLVPEIDYIIRVATDDTIAPAARVGEVHSVEPGERKTLGDVREVVP